MRRLAVLMGLVLSTALGWAAFSFPAPALAAKNACMCTCQQDPVTITKNPLGSSAQDCSTNICPRADVCNGANNVAGSSFSGNRCACQCLSYTKTSTVAPLTVGNSDCRADCSQSCGGTANTIGNGRVVSVDCVPGSNDCSGGSFGIYKGVSCVLQPASDPQNWSETNGQKPACVIPVTQENADKECAFYGGIAKPGGTCGAIASGENPNSYAKSRPKLGTTGTDYTQQYASFTAWQTAMNNEHPQNQINPTDGICYRLGILTGVGSTVGIGANVTAQAGVGASGGSASVTGGLTATGASNNGFVCLKKKTSTCGSVTPPASLSPALPARSYSCQTTTDVAANGKNPSKVCFPTNGSDGKGNNYADLCVTQPGTVCCQGGTVFTGCLTNSDCSIDRSKVCVGADPLKLIQGKCVPNTQCDPDPTHNIAIPANMSATPWMVDNRRCRYASPVEKANASICTPESIVPGALSLCPNSAQSCCRAANPAVTSGCAADLVLKSGSASVFNDFQCLSVSNLPDSQFVTKPDGSRHLVGIEEQFSSGLSSNPENYNGANSAFHCLTGPAPKYQAGVNDPNGLPQVVGSIPRCGAAQVCCNAAKVGVVDTRKAVGSACGTKSGYTCRSFSTMLPSSDAAAVAAGFASRDEYLGTLIQNPGCQFTPFSGGAESGANTECVANSLCCSADIPAFGQRTCTADKDCPSGMSCDQTLHFCTNTSLVKPQFNSESCFDRAKAEVGGTATQVQNVNPLIPTEVYTCQTVPDGTPDVNRKCLPAGKGCPTDQQFCCIPGVGQTNAAAAQQTVPTPAPSPYSIRLSPCISTGNCSLDDIVYTGAGFANFLIQVSGAIFLGIFVWGGFKYLTAGSSNRAADGKKMIIQATIAMALLMGAFAFISFIQSSIIITAGGKDPGQSQACTARSTKDVTYACKFLSSGTAAEQSKEISDKQCVRGLCPGPTNYVCCPQ
jgi:hypothetical protein